MTTEDRVMVTWRECDCEWATKLCDENHVQYDVVPLAGLLSLAGRSDDQLRKQLNREIVARHRRERTA